MSEGLVLRNVSKDLGGRTIVDSLDLEVDKGEFVCLLGPSGCGKTTTLRMVAGFLIPDGGTVTVGGRDVTTLPPEKRPSAMVFQSYALWPHMTVFKNVAFPLRLRNVGRAELTRRVEGALGMVGMMHHRDSRPARISGGEQQRVALARALVQEPDVLLLDEPLSNLDARLRVKVREEIREIQQRLGITTVMVTHDQDEAMAVADRVAVMNQGRIEQVSAPSVLYADPRTEFVAGFVGSLNKVVGRIVPGAGIVPGDAAAFTGIRPEDVRLARDDVEGSFPGEVLRVVPRGHFSDVTVRVPGGELRAFTDRDAWSVGEGCRVSVTRLLRFSDGERVAG